MGFRDVRMWISHSRQRDWCLLCREMSLRFKLNSKLLPEDAIIQDSETVFVGFSGSFSIGTLPNTTLKGIVHYVNNDRLRQQLTCCYLEYTLFVNLHI